MIYEHDDPKFPPDGYVVIATWPEKTEPPLKDGEPGPRKVSYKRKDMVSATDEVKKWLTIGYKVMVFQTINILVFNSEKDIKQ